MFSMFNRYYGLKPVCIMASECIITFLTIMSIAYVRFGLDAVSVMKYDPFYFKTLIMSLVYITTFYFFDLYSPDMYRPTPTTIMKLFKSIIVATIVLFSLYFLTPSVKTWRGILLANTFVLPFILLLIRYVTATWGPFEIRKEKVLIIGSGGLAKKFGQTIYHNSSCGLELAGFIDDDPARLGVSIVNPGVVGGYGDILRLVKSEGIRRIIVALPDRRAKLPMSALLDCKLMGVVIEEGETFNEKMEGKIPLEQLKPSWMVFSDGFKSLRSRKIIKRGLDLLLSTVLLILSLPLLLITPLLIKLESKGDAIFKQIRVGENGKEYEIYKFRSMRLDAEAKTGPVWAGVNDDRTTRVGRFIRKTRIDELPQLFNVLKGDMSFVGPRPERPFFVNELKKTIPYYEVRNVVKPGITGWTQVKYPYGATEEDAKEKLQYDIYYIKNMSPILDLIIAFMTIKVVLLGQGAR